MNENELLSSDIINGFAAIDYTIDALELVDIYKKLSNLIPKEDVSFKEFGRNNLIACEMICAAICHSINWNYLRRNVYRKTLENRTWIKKENMTLLTEADIFDLLKDYDKKDRILSKERFDLIKSIMNIFLLVDDFECIFFKKDTNECIEIEESIKILSNAEVFRSDPEQKKLQLLFQSLSDYEDFDYLNNHCLPTIDYHLIRMYLRRGLVKPKNKFCLDYIIDNDILRKERTVAALRKVCADSLGMVSWITSLSIKQINRIEWWVGRTVCTNESPDCFLRNKESLWLKDKFEFCPYYKYCYAFQDDNRFFAIKEPRYNGKSY